MLVGLLIAVREADDRPGMLTATLPFGGATLIEYQARLLAAAGAAQIIVVVARLTPELLGAIGRISRRGITVDAVRTAGEAIEKVHPLAHVVMLADGLTTTDEAVDLVARERGDALLVAREEDVAPGYERVGGGMIWAGVARLETPRLRELAAMPRDYDMQSTLLRLASQAGARLVPLPPGIMRQGHAIGHEGAVLEARGRTLIAAMVSTRRGWFDRIAVAPLARALVPELVSRGISSTIVAGALGALELGGLAALLLGYSLIGLLLALTGSIGLSFAAVLGELRDELRAMVVLRRLAAILPAAAILLYGHGQSLLAHDGEARVLATATVVCGALAERALSRLPRQRWWGSAPAYLLPVIVGAACSMPVVGLVGSALYAAATLAAAIERLREHP